MRVLLPDPPPGTRAALIALEYQNQLQLTALALDRPGDPPPPFPFAEHFRGEARVVALYHQETLSALGLEPGAVARAKSADRGRLPIADHAFAGSVLDDRIGAFEMIDPERPGAMIESFELDVTIAHDCFPLEVRVFELDTSAAPQAFTRYDARTALVVAESGEIFLVSSSSVTRASVTVDLEQGRPISAFRAPSGELWLGGQGGTVLRGDLRRGFTRMETRPHQHELAFLDGPRDASVPFELFGSTTDGEFDRYSAATDTWTTLETVDVDTNFSFGATVWLGEEHAVMTPPFTRRIVGYERGALRDLELAPAHGEIRTLFQLHDGALLAISDPPAVFRIERDGYEPILEATESASPRSAAPLGDGFVYLGNGGTLVQWQPVDGYCPIVQVPLGDTIPLRTVELDDAVLVLASDKNVGDGIPVAPRVTVLEWPARR